MVGTGAVVLRRFDRRSIAVQFSFPREEYSRCKEGQLWLLRKEKGRQVPSVLSGHVIGRKRQKYAPIGRPAG